MNTSPGRPLGLRPTPGDPNETTYQGTVWTNDVDCGQQQVNQDSIAVGAKGSPSEQAAGLEVCNEGGGATPAPVQGRVIVGGSFEEEGIHATADGDKDNAAGGQGWTTVHVGAEPTVTCSDDNGRLDSQHPNGESQAGCPAPSAP